MHGAHCTSPSATAIGNKLKLFAAEAIAQKKRRGGNNCRLKLLHDEFFVIALVMAHVHHVTSLSLPGANQAEGRITVSVNPADWKS